MSHLDYILQEVRKTGSYEEPWHVLTNAYFRGKDKFEQIESWAELNGLTVSFSDQRETCWFKLKQP